MGGRSQRKAEQSNYDHQKAFIYNALAQLSPENIAQLQRMFLPYIMAQQSAIGQTAMHGLARSQAQRGLAQSPISASQQLGLKASLANSAQQQAFQQAFGLAGQRANVWMQQPSQAAPNYHMANAIPQAVQLGLLTAALAGKNGQQQAPQQYTNNWNDNWGLTPGLPPSYYYGQPGPSQMPLGTLQWPVVR